MRGERALTPFTLLAVTVVVAACRSTGERESVITPAVSHGEHEASSVEAWTYRGRRGSVTAIGPLRAYTNTVGVLQQRVPRFARGVMDHCRETLAPLPEPRGPLELYVLATREDWTRMTLDLYGPEGLARYGAILRGGFTERSRSLVWDLGVQDTFAIVAHETWHQLAQSVLVEPLPVWLDEGLAAWSEGFRWDPLDPARAIHLPWANVERHDQLRADAETGRLMPLSRLLVERPQDLIKQSDSAALGYYAQCWALAHFLVEGEGGRRREPLSRLLMDAQRGRVGAAVRAAHGQRAARNALTRRVGSEVFETYFGPVERASAEYDRFVREVVAPGAKSRIVEGRSPIGP